MLDLVDEAFDRVALSIQVAVILSLLITVEPRRDNRLDAWGDECFDEVGAVIALVGDQRTRLEAFD